MAENAEMEVAGNQMAARGGALLSVEQVRNQLAQVRKLMADAMEEGRHYGKIPGTNKPTLLKGGAELLNVMFRLSPRYIVTQEREGDHLTVTSVCRLIHIPTDNLMAEGLGICSTKESKYAFRNARAHCPACGVEAIFRSKAEWGGGYYCNKKSGGCGASFKPGTDKVAEIEKQNMGKVPNEYLADLWNTIIKMANKRSLVAASLNATAASDIFTQDVEEIEENEVAGNPAAGGAAPAPVAAVNGGKITSNQASNFYAAAYKSKKAADEIKTYIKGLCGGENAGDLPDAMWAEAFDWAQGKER